MESTGADRPLLTTERHGTGSGSKATTVLVLSTLIAVCGSYNFGAAVGYSSPAESGIVDELGLSVAEYSVFGSVLTIGAMLGSIVSGKTADLVGRRGAMGISQLFSTAGWVAVAFSQGAWSLDIGRLMIGFGVGLVSFVVPVYIAEITPRNLRGGFATAHQFMVCFGSGFTYFVGAVVNWRILALLELVPCLVQLVSLPFIPESPRWLAKVGREKEYETALRRLRGKNADISAEAADIRDYMEMLQQISEGTIRDLFQKIYARSLLVGVGLMVLQQFGGTNGIAFYASSIFEDAGFPSNVGPVAMTIVQIPIVVVGVLLMDRSGRRPLLMVSAEGTCFGCFLVGLAFLLEGLKIWIKVDPSLVFVGMLIYSGAFGLGLAGIPWLIMSEIFPINMKGSAGSLVSLVNWFSSWIVTYIFNFLMDLSSSGTFFLFSVMSGLTVLFVAKLVPETKGRMLEEIQAAMNPLPT